MKGSVKLLRNTFFLRDRKKKKNRYRYVFGNEINQITKH